MADIAELIVALKLQDGVSSGLGRLNGQLRGMQTGFSQVGRGLGQVGTGLDRIATRGAIAAAAGLTAVVTAAVSFEDAFAGVRKTVDATEGEFGQLEDRLREMARTMPVSFEELAGIAEAGGALGIAFEGLDEFTKVVADLAATTDLSADQAATSLGVLGNVLGLLPEDFDNFGSALVDLGNKGASTESQILGIAERIGATGELIGLSSDQVLGFGAAVANTGIEVEAGGSALQRFFIDALTAVESGGEGLETFARTAGVSAESFRDSFRNDAGAALTDFIEGLGELPEAVQIQTLADLGFNDVRITRTLLGLATDTDNLRDSLNIAAEAFAANSALGEEAAKRYATTASQLKILKQNVIDAAVTIGDQLLPVITDLTSEFVAFINTPEVREGIKVFAEDLAGGIRSFVDEIKKADFGPLLDGLRGAASIAKAGFDAFRALPPGVQSLALAAFGINKLTGGGLSAIAGGLGNIIGGGIKILFERGASPANPLWVQSVGGVGGIGGATPTGGASSIGKIALGVTGVGLAALLASEFEDEIDGLAQDIHDNLGLPDLPGPADWQWPLGSKNPPGWLPDFLGGPGPDLSNPFGLTPEEGRAALQTFVREGLRNVELGAKLLLPGFSEARNVTDRSAPATDVQPIVNGVATVNDSVKALPPILTKAHSDAQSADQANRTANALLVTEQNKTRTSTVEWLNTLAAEARSADTANRTANAFQTAELARTRAATVERLTTLAGKYDIANANLSGANRQLGIIASKNPIHPVTVNNAITIPVSISATLLEQRLIQARMTTVGQYSLTGAGTRLL